MDTTLDARANTTAIDRRGLVYFGGEFDFQYASTESRENPVVLWNGSSLFPVSTDFPEDSMVSPSASIIRSIATSRDGKIAFGYDDPAGTPPLTVQQLVINEVYNPGTADTYPMIIFEGFGIIYEITNFTTGDSIYFGFALGDEQRAVLDLTPGNISFRSQLRDLFQYIQPGSNLATFRLVPGTNRIGLFQRAGLATILWHAAHWSIDGGAKR